MFDLDDDEDLNIQESEGGDKMINETTTETNNNTLLNFPDHLKENLTNGHKDFQQVHDPSDPFIPKIEEYLQKNKLCMVTYPEILEKNILNKPSKKSKVSRISPIVKIKSSFIRKG